ncbi:hypothetical protein LUZ60_012687 [Juncus effusus]|nr:hypothetical protein LUZ60_012687 [Juncus effusus]
MDEEKKTAIKDEKVPLYKLFSFSDRWDQVLMLIGFLGALANGLAMPLMTFVFGELINAFGIADRNNVVHDVSKVSIKFVYLGVASAVASFLQVSCWMVTGERQAARIRGLYLKTILRQDVGFFDTETTTGEVIGRMSGDTVLIQDAIGEKVGKFIQLMSTFVGGFVVAFTKGWLLSLVLLSSFPLITMAAAVMALAITKLSTKSQLAYAEAGNIVEQTVGAIRTVVSFTGEKSAMDKYHVLLKSAYKVTVYQGVVGGAGMGTVTLCVFGSFGLAIWYGAQLIITKGYNGGTVINVMMAIMTGAMSLGQTSPCINAFAAGQAAAYKMFQTIYRQPSIDVYDMDGIVLEEIKGDIDLKNVHFRYPARPDQLIFNDFSLHVPHGTTMALVGESGSGKSTVISLVERFYDPDHGEVLIDGVNLKDMKLSWIREKIGLVSQEPVLFTTTIRENILYGKPNATDEEIRSAIEQANAAKFVNKLPNGLDTMVGEHGTQLSGGQKQRIAIARAILKDPKILLLDEATSALDAESEKMVQDALSKLMVARTTIVVAHRLSTIKNANKISVVQRGKIIEQGSHSELLENPDGAYSQLIRLQEINGQEEQESPLEPRARLSADASSIRGLVGDSLALIVQNLATVVSGLIIAMDANWKMAFIVIALLPCVGAQGYAQIMFLKGFSSDAKEKYEEASTVANDAVGSIRTVASFCAEKTILDTYEKKCGEPVKQGVRLGIVFYALVMTAIAVSQSSAMGSDSNKAKEAATSIFKIIDKKSKIDASTNQGLELASVKGEIEFQHVSFHYPIRPNVEIFRDLCLYFPAGKTVALVGESGSGKSTVIALLERFYDPNSGSILMDGHELKSLKLNWLRQQMGLVGQEPVLFEGTIASNIAYGKQGDVSEEEIIEAAKAANAHGFISSLHDGYGTNVGERGIQLSGGQKQRIAIARAILKNPRILLLDEATSALDAESERVVQETLDRVMVCRTSIVVAHRLSTVSNADKIAVVKEGVIAEQGRHEELIKMKDGAYASLVALHSSSS